jgi:hypothetical protein
MADGGYIKERLEDIRERIENWDISYGEIAELQRYKEYIDKNDTQLLEWAGVPEFEDDVERNEMGDEFVSSCDVCGNDMNSNQVSEMDNVCKSCNYAKGGQVMEIQKIKNKLISKAKSKGIYENFGQNEVRMLEDKYGNTNEIREFDNWAMNFDLSDLKQYAGGGEIDLFEDYEKQPKELAEIVEVYEERYADGDMNYESTKEFLDKVNAIGYTFDFGLDNEPYNLRPMMAKGGMMADDEMADVYEYELVWKGETIDTADTMETAKYLQNEYETAYGGSVRIKKIALKNYNYADGGRINKFQLQLF